MKAIDIRNKAAVEEKMEAVKGGAIFTGVAAGQTKTGTIPAINLTPGTCGTCCCNCPGCYAKKGRFVYQAVIDKNAERTAMATLRPEIYWAEVDFIFKTSRYVRYFGSGDMGITGYFEKMVETAKNNPGTLAMAFTEHHETVNAWIDKNGDLPKNLIIIFSTLAGKKIDNRHNLPVAVVVDDVEKAIEDHPDWLACGGSCENCACRGLGCWRIKKGETLILKKH